MTHQSHISPGTALRQVLSDCANDEELRRLLYDVYGPDLLNELPSAGSSTAKVAYEAVRCLERRGLVSEQLFIALIAHAPGRKDEILEVAAAWGLQLSFKIALPSLPAGLQLVDPANSSQEQSNSSAKRFFLGHPPTWADLKAEVDIRRSAIYNGRVIQYNELLDTVRQTPGPSNLFILFGEGGAGKTTVMRRLMYDLSQSNTVVLRHQHDAALEANKIAKFLQQAGIETQIYIVIDDASRYASQIFALADELSYSPVDITIIAAARLNEWNSATRHLHVTVPHDTFVLSRLSEAEAQRLIDNLSKFDALGSLARLSAQQRLEEFTVKAGNQLLVALLEATHGKRFRDIVIDEYRGISNKEASHLYLTICLFERLGLRTPEVGAIKITRSSDSATFLDSILPDLELVIIREEMRSGVDLSPRHSVVAEELVRHAIGSGSERLQVCFDALERMAEVKRPERRIQDFAARLASRILKRDLIRGADDAQRAVDLLLAAGVGDYQRERITRGHSLRPQKIASRSERRFSRFYKAAPGNHPSLVQFRACVPILRAASNDDEAIRLIQEGLRINNSWSLLKLDWAVIESERGNGQRAEELVADILTQQTGGDNKIVLPIRLAVEIARFRKGTDKHLALRYLELARTNATQGMLDHDQYFLRLAHSYDENDRPEESIDTIKAGLNLIKGPQWAVENLERLLAHQLYAHKPNEFLAWIERYYDSSRGKPSSVMRLEVEHAIRTGNQLLAERVWRIVPQGLTVISDLIRCYAEQDKADTDRLEFLLQVTGMESLPDATLRVLINKHIRARDQGALQNLHRNSRAAQRVIKLVIQELVKRGTHSELSWVTDAVGYTVSSDDAILSILGRTDVLKDDTAVSILISQLREIDKVRDDVAHILLVRSIQARRKDLATETLRHTRSADTIVTRVKQAVLKSGRADDLFFIEEIFGRQASLEPWIAMTLLHSAMLAGDSRAAVEACSRTANLDATLSMLAKRLKVQDLNSNEFIQSVLQVLVSGSA